MKGLATEVLGQRPEPDLPLFIQETRRPCPSRRYGICASAYRPASHAFPARRANGPAVRRTHRPGVSQSADGSGTRARARDEAHPPPACGARQGGLTTIRQLTDQVSRNCRLTAGPMNSTRYYQVQVCRIPRLSYSLPRRQTHSPGRQNRRLGSCLLKVTHTTLEPVNAES